MKQGINCKIYKNCGRDCMHCVAAEAMEKYKMGQWIPSEEPPESGKYVLLSFENFPIPLVGRYEKDDEGDGAFYVGDDEESCISQDIIVNAWMPLPELYKN